jgi:folate-binding protein YgfZ
MSATSDLTVSSSMSHEAPSLNGCLPLDHYGVIRAQGADAATFLHGQLTNDFALLGTREARLAAFCNAKGRMQASFIGFKHPPDDVWLVCSADLLASTLKRLSLFVLRAKARLTDGSAVLKAWGLAGTAVPAHLPKAWWSAVSEGERTWIRLPDAGATARALLCQPASNPPPTDSPLSIAQWQWLEVCSGVTLITQPLYEVLVPQMLNYESVGGVNFKKGCYPGQEVVARSQFRGTLKRRTYLLNSTTGGTPGQDVYHAADPAQPCGVVVLSAPNPAGGHDMLVSMQVSAADGQTLTLGTPDGPFLALRPLPYDLLADI